MSALSAPAANSVSAALLAFAACSLCSATAALGCGSDPPPANRPGPGMVLSNPTSSSAASPTPSSDPARGPGWQQPSLSSGRVQPPPKAADDTKAPAPPEKQERDYSAELTQLLGSTVNCLTGHDSRKPISISVSAQVMPSGAISRADASGPGLTPVELSCIQKRVGTLRLNSPIEGAPRNVSAQLTLQAQATKEAPQPKAADDQADNDGDENPHDSKLKEVSNDPVEVHPRDEPVREMPEAPDGRDEPLREDTHAE